MRHWGYLTSHVCWKGKRRPYSVGTVTQVHEDKDGMLNVTLKCNKCNKVERRWIDRTQVYL